MSGSEQSSPIDRLTAEQQERLASLLDDYLSDREHDLPPDVDAVLESHPDLREAFLASLRSLEFLDRAAIQMAGDGVDTTATKRPRSISQKQLGDFVLVREIGRGGMGVVYEAKQISLDRQVALKVLPFAAVLDQKQITRFENEARAAAQLHHPNIVPVYSVGCERGVHYYAMQYVDGGSLDRILKQIREREMPGGGGSTALVDEPTRTIVSASVDTADERSTLRALSTIQSSPGRDYYRAICRIGIQAAEALEHAHECGIVHRDVKPSNLLVDRTGKLWVTDFGLARFQASDAGLTLTGQVLGSLRYMSPEQAAGNANLLDQRSDVYSLGVTLYEALTLRPAFEGDDRAELLRRISSEEPRPPRRVKPSIPADLETIVLKAISKAPESRYATAQDLADDLRRFLDGKPTHARRPTLVDRAGKWTRRHIRLVAAAACISIVAAVGLAASTWMIAGAHGRTKAALEQSESNRLRAESHYRQAREIVDRFGVGLAEELAQVHGAEAVRAQLLLDTLRYYEGFAAHAADDPDLQADLAYTRFKTGKIQEQIGDRSRALAEYRQALAAFTLLAEDEEPAADFRSEMALCHNDMGLLLGAEGKVDEAIGELRAALALQQRLLDDRPHDVHALNDKALTLGNLGMIEHRAGDLAAAEKHFLAAAEIQEDLVDRYPDELEYRTALAVTYNNLSFAFAASNGQRAEAACRKALAIQERLAELRPESVDCLSDLGLSYNNLAAILGHSGHDAEAIEAYHQAVEIRRQLVRMAPFRTQFRSDLAVSCNNLGRAYSESGDQQQALGPLGEAVELFEQLVSDYPGELNQRSCLGGAQNNLAMAHQQLGNPKEAEIAFRAAVEHQRYALERATSVARFRQFLSNHYHNLGKLLQQQGRVEEAVEIALARKQLWPEDAQRLFSVAVELAEIVTVGADADGQAGETAAARVSMVFDTLREAVEAGFADCERLLSEPALAALRQSPEFVALLSRLQSGNPPEGAVELPQHTVEKPQRQTTS